VEEIEQIQDPLPLVNPNIYTKKFDRSRKYCFDEDQLYVWYAVNLDAQRDIAVLVDQLSTQLPKQLPKQLP